MKNLKKLFLGCLILFTVTACKKEDGVGNTKVDGFMTAKVDGKDWSGGYAVEAQKGSPALRLAGTGDGGQINIDFFNYTGPKTYTIGGSISNSANNTNASYTATTLPPVMALTLGGLGSGSITITKDEGGYVEGTFSFNAKTGENGKTVTVTEGKFKAKIK